jgi:hypothetical protein
VRRKEGITMHTLPPKEGVPERRTVNRRPWAVTATRGAVWFVMLVVPSIVTVLRYTDPSLNADGVEQSVMSIQEVDLFYWGQDRLLPVVSFLASPISNPTANLWVCLVLQAMSFHGLLLYIAHRAFAQHPIGGWCRVPLTYRELVACAHSLLTSSTLHILALEGQPYALSWLLTALSYQAWKRGERALQLAAVACMVVALGVNPSVVLLAGFFAFTAVLRERRYLRWVAYLALFAIFLVVWTLLSHQFGGQATSDAEPAPSYFGFSLSDFRVGFAAAIGSVVEHLRPLRTVGLVLVALGATIALSSPLRARMTLYGAHFAWFTVLYVTLFAGNSWVAQNAFFFRYFFPLLLLILMAVALPIAGVALEYLDRTAPAESPQRSVRRGSLATAFGLAAVVLALVGTVSMPQNAGVFRAGEKTQAYAASHEVRFLSGAYWNMFPLMHGLLVGGRDAVFVAAEKSGGSRERYEQALDDELSRNGMAQALCVNESVESCVSFLEAWTRPGWRALDTNDRCPAPPLLGPPGPGGTSRPKCRVLIYDPSE